MRDTTADLVHWSCSSSCITTALREEALNHQLSALMEAFALPEHWATQMLERLKTDETDSTASSVAFVQESKEKVVTLAQKLQRLLDSYLEQDIEREVYVTKKAELMSEKKSLEEQIVNLQHQKMGWIEPLRNWINEAQSGGKIARDHDLGAKKVIAKKMFGLYHHTEKEL